MNANLSANIIRVISHKDTIVPELIWVEKGFIDMVPKPKSLYKGPDHCENISRSMAVTPVTIGTLICLEYFGRNCETVHFLDVLKNTQKFLPNTCISVWLSISYEAGWKEYSYSATVKYLLSANLTTRLLLTV